MKTITLLGVLFLIVACDETNPIPADIDFRQAMRNFVIDLSVWSKSQNSDFLIIPQNGQELITDTGNGDGVPQADYLIAIDAAGRENMFYGYYADDQETPEADRQHLIDLCVLCESQGVEILATDYCSTPNKMDQSYILNEQYSFISFAADERELNHIPEYPPLVHNENDANILTISDARNFLYLINSENFSEKADLISAVSASNYDLIIMDLFHNESAYSSAEVTQLKTKANGGSRLVICYMSIGEAEDYRYYWNPDWSDNKPAWLEPENPDWPGNYKVRYWTDEWQEVIFGNDSAYLQLILNAGFDGVYLDIIDGFEYFAEL